MPLQEYRLSNTGKMHAHGLLRRAATTAGGRRAVVTTNFDDAFPSAAESPLAYLLQHARTYVPGTWGIDAGMMEQINQQEGWALTAGGRVATDEPEQRNRNRNRNP